MVVFAPVFVVDDLETIFFVIFNDYFLTLFMKVSVGFLASMQKMHQTPRKATMMETTRKELGLRPRRSLNPN